jgi:hypothetical protein
MGWCAEVEWSEVEWVTSSVLLHLTVLSEDDDEYKDEVGVQVGDEHETRVDECDGDKRISTGEEEGVRERSRDER